MALPPKYVATSVRKVNRNDNNKESFSDDDNPAQFFADLAVASPVSRRRFIAKVYIILFLQLCATAVIGFFIRQAIGDGNSFIAENFKVVYISCLAGAFACLCAMSCCPNVFRPFPINYIFLCVVTGLLSVLVGISASRLENSDVGVAVGITAVLFAVFTVIAIVVKKDFTGYGKYLFIAFLVLFLFAIAIFIFGAFTSSAGGVKTLRYLAIGLSVAVVILSCCYIVYDTQQIVGGKNRQYVYSTDDYCFAAISLYLDIFNMLTSLMSIMGMT